MRKWKKCLYLLTAVLFLWGIPVTVWGAEEEIDTREPARVQILSQKSNAAARRYTIYWKKADLAEGYQVELYQGQEKLSARNLKETAASYEFKQIRQGQLYRFRIRAYRKVTNPYSGVRKTIYGKYHTGYFVQQPRVKFQWKNKKAVQVSWTPVEGAVNYRVYLSTRRGSGYRQAAKVKNCETTLKKLKLETTYYVYVVADYKVKKERFSTAVTYSYPFRLQLK